MAIPVPKIDVESLNRQVRSLADRAMAALDRKRRPIQEKIRTILEGLILEAYDVKSHGGKGSDGITWSPDQPSTVKAKGGNLIGVRSGDLRSSCEVTVQGGSSSTPDIVAAFNAPYAEFFDQERKLLPDDLPDAWSGAIEGPVEKWIEETVKSEVDAAGLR